MYQRITVQYSSNSHNTKSTTLQFLKPALEEYLAHMKY